MNKQYKEPSNMYLHKVRVKFKILNYNAVFIKKSLCSELGIRRRRSTFDDDLDLVSILKSLNSTEDTLNQGENEIVDTDQLSPANLCKIKFNFCQISHNARSSNMLTKKVTYYENIKNLFASFHDC